MATGKQKITDYPLVDSLSGYQGLGTKTLDDGSMIVARVDYTSVEERLDTAVTSASASATTASEAATASVSASESALVSASSAKDYADAASASSASASTASDTASSASALAVAAKEDASASVLVINTVATKAIASASAANTSAVNASNYASDAKTYRDNASASATSAASSAVSAKASADKAQEIADSIGSGGGGTIIIDSELSTTSTHAVQNKVITSAINGKADSSAIPTKTSQLTNDSGYLTSHQDISGKQDTLTTAQMNAVNSGITAAKVSTYDGYATTISGKMDKVTLAAVATSGSYNDLKDKPTIPEGAEVDSSLSTTSTNAVQNKVVTAALASKADTSAIPSLSGYATESWVEGKGYLTSHQSLDGYATESWVEGKGYLTSHQSLAGYAKTTDIPTKTSDLTNDSNFVASTSLAAVATSGSYNDLTGKPTIPDAVTVDSALSSTSENPVQNKVIYAALGDISTALDSLNTLIGVTS